MFRRSDKHGWELLLSLNEVGARLGVQERRVRDGRRDGHEHEGWWSRGRVAVGRLCRRAREDLGKLLEDRRTDPVGAVDLERGGEGSF